MPRIAYLFSLIVVAAPALAWDAQTHRLVTRLALENLEHQAAAWLKTDEQLARIAFQSNQVDRWRGSSNAALRHTNDPDHYLDVELLEEFGLTLETLPPLRREYLRVVALAKHLHPERVSPYNPAKDQFRTHEWPGFLLHRIAEEYGALQAALTQVRILEQLDEPRRAAQLAQSRTIVVTHLGNLAHFVADAAQPLHTTKHFNGWVGDNPGGYTTAKTFHAYIDHGIIEHHGFTLDALRPRVKLARRVAPLDDPWKAVREYFEESFAAVEPLYRLDRDDLLTGPEGRLFIETRLLAAVEMLHALIQAALESSVPTEEQIADFVKYNHFDATAATGEAAAANSARPAESAPPAVDEPDDGG